MAEAPETPIAKAASRQDHGRGSFFIGRRRARHRSNASTEYSATWLPLRTTACTARIVWSETFGLSQRNSGPMMREVRCDESTSVEPPKISPIQSTTGSQNMQNEPFPDTAG